ncbi:hypothetical protein J1614_001564 [Plenodomus biglobosus]|nr:hypothetical protein J1614_001564 [Plenodomus biglobosus]
MQTDLMRYGGVRHERPHSTLVSAPQPSKAFIHSPAVWSRETIRGYYNDGQFEHLMSHWPSSPCQIATPKTKTLPTTSIELDRTLHSAMLAHTFRYHGELHPLSSKSSVQDCGGA